MLTDRLAKHKTTVHLTLVFLVSVCLRLWGIAHDLPNVYHMDVVKVVNTAVMFHRCGHFSAHDWDKPTAHMHIYAFGLAAYEKTRNTALRLLSFPGRTFAAHTAGDSAERPRLSTTENYLVCRVISALFGAGIPIILFFTAALAGGRRMGLIAAWMGCLCPHLAEYAHTENAYTMLAFFCLLSFYFSLRRLLDENAGKPSLVLAGVFAGYAVQTQFNAFPVLLPAVFALFSGQEKPFSKTALASAFRLGAWLGAGFAAGMTVSDPYFILDIPGFVSGVLDKFFRYTAPIERFWTFEDPIPLVILKDVCAGLGPAFCLLAAIGALFSPFRNRRFFLMTAVFPLLSWAVLSRMNVAFPRYILAALPFCLLFAAYALDFIIARMPKTPAGAAGAMLCLALVFFQPAAETIESGFYFSLKDTRDSAAEWLENNAAPGANIIAEKYEPPVPENRFRFSMVFSLSDHELEKYRKLGVRYLITSDYLSRRYTKKHSPENVTRYEEMDRRLRTAASFSMKHLLLFYHPRIKIYELLPSESRMNPLTQAFPNTAAPGHGPFDVLYPDNALFGRDPMCLALGDQKTVTRYIRSRAPLDTVGLLLCAGNDKNRFHVSLNGSRTRVKTGAFKSRLAFLSAPRAKGEATYRLDLRADSDDRAFVRVMTDSFSLGQAALLHGLADDAVDFFERRLKAAPDDIMAWLFLSRALAKTGQSKKAFAALAKTGFTSNSNRLGWIFDSSQSQSWNRRFRHVFGVRAGEIEELRTLRIKPGTEQCPDDKRICFDPAADAMRAVPNDDYRDKPSRFIKLSQLRLARGWYEIETRVRAAVPDGRSLPENMGADTKLMLVKAQVAGDGPEKGRSHLSGGMLDSNGQAKVRLMVFCEGWNQPLDVSCQTLNRCDLVVGRITIRPKIALSLCAAVLDSLTTIAAALRTDGSTIQATDLENFIKIHTSLLKSRL